MSVSDDRISQLLSSPENLQKIAEIAKSLSLSGFGSGQNKSPDAAEGTGEPVSESTPAAAPASAEESASMPTSASFNMPDIGKIISGLNISPALLGSLGKAAQGFNDGEKRVTLLNAMKPFTHGNNTGTVDRAITALKIARAARLFMEK